MPPSGVATLLPGTIRRSLLVGRFYLVIGTAISTILALELALGRHHLFASTFPLEVPIFAILGSMGCLMIFTADRTKGVFEYLIAYGVRPQALFASSVLASLAVTTVMLGAILAVGLGIFYGSGGSTTPDLEKNLALYTFPMSYAGSIFATTVGMYWSSLSTPRMGMNSPVGIAPFFGIGPTIVVLIIAETAPASEYYDITAGVAGIIVAVSAILLASSGKIMRRERFLSLT
ncbi:MAG: hypothetical protein ACREC5_03905 [Thermoplasmata archaeon]